MISCRIGCRQTGSTRSRPSLQPSTESCNTSLIARNWRLRAIAAKLKDCIIYVNIRKMNYLWNLSACTAHDDPPLRVGTRNNSEVTVNSNARLGDYPTTPLYNIKAVVHATGITPSTLRAWERRYNMCQPQRSESGYRLYSERDLAIIRWLKFQVDAGMSISQAVAWMDNIVEQAGGMEEAVLPGAGIGVDEAPVAQQARISRKVRDYSSLQQEMLAALLDYDEARADELMSEAFAMYSVEQVGEHIVMPVLVEIGELWHQGTVSVTIEHFATSYLLQRLSALLRTVPAGNGESPIWVGCAPGELHEVGAMLLSIYLRRAGYPVHYLGQSLHIEDVANDAARKRPAMILLSATTEEAARQLSQLTARLAELAPQRPLIGYGGQIFDRRPELRANITGVYMGANADEAVEVVNELLRNDAHTKRRS
jgi:MerR family transcriptional regulator, light-induced transcriptional regulator